MKRVSFDFDSKTARVVTERETPALDEALLGALQKEGFPSPKVK